MKFSVIVILNLLPEALVLGRETNRDCHRWVPNSKPYYSTFTCKTNPLQYFPGSACGKKIDEKNFANLSSTNEFVHCACNVENVSTAIIAALAASIVASIVAPVVALTAVVLYEKYGRQNNRREYEDVVAHYPIQCTEDP